MKRLRVVLLVAALSAPAVPAHAAEIGLLGGDFDPQSIFDMTFQDLTSPCRLALPSGYFCAQYQILSDPPSEGSFPIHSIDFQLLDSAGEFFHHSALEGELAVDSVFSQLGILTASPLFEDDITFRLQDDTVYCYVGHCSAEFFSSDHTVRQVSIVGVNGVANEPVPEPATLFLLGSGAAALVARHRARRRALRSPG